VAEKKAYWLREKQGRHIYQKEEDKQGIYELGAEEG